MRLRHKLAGAALGLAVAIATPFVAHWEGTRYTAYQDVAGVWTICTGHTAGVNSGDTATQRQCDAWLQEDLRIANAAIDRCIHIPLTPNQHAALLSAVYNIGPDVVCDSTLGRLANAGADPNIWCEQLPRWNHSAGKVVRGLTLRREAERDLCLTP